MKKLPSEQSEREGGQGGETGSSGPGQTTATVQNNLPLEGALPAPVNAFLRKLELALQEYLKETYLPSHRAKLPTWSWHDVQFFSRGAEMVSTAFTEERATLPKNYFNKKEFRSAYLLYFVLTNAAKVWKCLEQAAPHLGSGPLRILDLGCGPATASLACAAFFQDRPLHIFGLEQNKGITKDAYGIWKKMAFASGLKIKNETVDARNIKKILQGKKFDLVIAANFLNEFPRREQVILCEEVLNVAKIFIIIDPALQKTTRELMALRDRLVKNKSAQVLAPCLHQQNCPMLAANKRDWCHFYIDWKCPLIIREVDQIVGNKHDYLKMAYMILVRAKRCQQYTAGTFWRVVSSPLVSRGKKELILCGDNGELRKIDRLDKDKSYDNANFDYAKRGDILEWSGQTRVGQKDKIKVLKKF